MRRENRASPLDGINGGERDHKIHLNVGYRAFAAAYKRPILFWDMENKICAMKLHNHLAYIYIYGSGNGVSAFCILEQGIQTIPLPMNIQTDLLTYFYNVSALLLCIHILRIFSLCLCSALWMICYHAAIAVVVFFFLFHILIFTPSFSFSGFLSRTSYVHLLLFYRSVPRVVRFTFFFFH